MPNGDYRSGANSKWYSETTAEQLTGFVSSTGFGPTRNILSGPKTEDGTTEYAGGNKGWKTGTVTWRAYHTETRSKLDALNDGLAHDYVVDRQSTGEVLKFKLIIQDISESAIDSTSDPTFTVNFQQVADPVPYSD